MTSLRFDLELPAWLRAELEGAPDRIERVRDRVRFAVRLAGLGAARGAGGPFGAAVFEVGTGRLVAAGTNLVLAGACSLLHAEIVALVLAQKRVGHYDLGAAGEACELVASAEPCAMCLGAVPWSGVRRLVCGARDEDVRAIGFDEGAKVADWPGELERRGVAVERDVCRAEAREVLERYGRGGGEVYNAGRGFR
jgi:tRNA(Arg) A34 adenosine deaminase TadA